MYAPTSQGMLAPLQPFLDDKTISEILINRPQEVYVEKHGVMESHYLSELTERRLSTLFQLIANENHQELSNVKPLLSGSLLDGTRVQLVTFPVSNFPVMSLRRKIVIARTLDDYDQDNYFYASVKKAGQEKSASEEEYYLKTFYEQASWSEFIRLAIRLKKTIIISGGTSSGKTTFLSACLQTIPNNERLILLEDTREIVPSHSNQVSLLATKGEQGLSSVTTQDLVQASLRLRPDRIIIGEIRGKEIVDFLGAASTGHEGSMTSIHANNPQMAFMRMAQMYKLNNVPSMSDADIYQELKAVIDIIIQLEKTPQGRAIQSIYYRDASKKGDGNSQ